MTAAYALLLRRALGHRRTAPLARRVLATPECWPLIEQALARSVGTVTADDGEIVVPCSPLCDRENWPEGSLGQLAWCFVCGPGGYECISLSECLEGED